MLIAIAAVMMVVCQQGVMAFMSSFFTRVHGTPIDRAGLLVGLMPGFGAQVSMPLGGIVTDLVIRKPMMTRLALIALMTLVSMPFAVIGYLADSISFACANIFVFELLCPGAYAATLTSYMKATPANMRGACSAVITVLAITLAGGLGPVITSLPSV